jgi:hypothetical protein
MTIHDPSNLDYQKVPIKEIPRYNPHPPSTHKSTRSYMTYWGSQYGMGFVPSESITLNRLISHKSHAFL